MIQHILLILVALFLSQGSFAGGTENEAVQRSMINYVKAHSSENGTLPMIYKGKVLHLSLDKSKKYPTGFHSGVKAKGRLYTSCADFRDNSGNKYDVDFLVNKTQKGYQVVQPIVHSVNGKKNPYDLKH